MLNNEIITLNRIRQVLWPHSAATTGIQTVPVPPSEHQTWPEV